MKLSSEYSSIVNAVIDASRLCMAVRQRFTGEAAKIKNDESPVTVADFGAQAIILHHLSQLEFGYPIVAEEDVNDLVGEDNQLLRTLVVDAVKEIKPDLSETQVIDSIANGGYQGGAQGSFWTLDPIDGTKGFLRGGQYAVALALIVDGEVRFSVLGCPNLPHCWGEEDSPKGSLFVAEAGRGCWQLDILGDPIRQVRVDGISNPTQASFCESVELGHSRHEWAASIAATVGIRRKSVRLDSQCKYAAVARGDASIYLRLPTQKRYQEKIWDHAAGYLAVIEAGGRVSDIEGKPLDFSCGRCLENNRGIIASNGKIHDSIVNAAMSTC